MITVCYAKNAIGETVLIRRGEMGYFKLSDERSMSSFQKIPIDRLNTLVGVTKEQADAMVAGSMFGWDCPQCKILGEDKNNG
jgi:hypothetical protein